jgi:hypothetical protein
VLPLFLLRSVMVVVENALKQAARALTITGGRKAEYKNDGNGGRSPHQK